LVEPAKSGRSSCKCCGDKIQKGALRMGTHVDGGDDGYDVTKWFHLSGCFNKKIKKGPKERGDIKGMDSLSPSQQTKVMKHVFGDGEDSSSSDEDDDIPIHKLAAKSPKTKKRKLESSDDDEPPRKRRKLSMDDIDGMKVSELKAECKAYGLAAGGRKREIQQRLRDFVAAKAKEDDLSDEQKAQQKALRKAEKKRFHELVQDLQSLRVVDLKAMLSHNAVIRTGNKADLIERVADCKMYGTYPRCPECGGGVLRVRYSPHKFGHNGQGIWHCKGYMEDDEFVRCNFRTTDTMERAKWRELEK